MKKRGVRGAQGSSGKGVTLSRTAAVKCTRTEAIPILRHGLCVWGSASVLELARHPALGPFLILDSLAGGELPEVRDAGLVRRAHALPRQLVLRPLVLHGSARQLRHANWAVLMMVL